MRFDGNDGSNHHVARFHNHTSLKSERLFVNYAISQCAISLATPQIALMQINSGDVVLMSICRRLVRAERGLRSTEVEWGCGVGFQNTRLEAIWK
jgi:hypothetical protein